MVTEGKAHTTSADCMSEAHRAAKPLTGSVGVHLLLRRLLGAFDAVCQEFGLTYIATHGTLLGAVRDKGFAPGDDDIDVAMPRADFEKLLDLASLGVFPDPFFMQSIENDPSNFYGGYAKLRDLSEEAKAYGDSWFDPDQGVTIDVLPLDDCPASDEARDKMRERVRFWQRLLYAKTYPWDTTKLFDVDARAISAYFLFASCVKRAWLCAWFRAACTACEHTGLLTVFAGNYAKRGNAVLFEESDIVNAQRVAFGNMTIPVPRHAEEWLEAYYGSDWMIPSSEYVGLDKATKY